MAPEEHIDWTTLVAKPWTSRHEDKRRGPGSLIIPLSVLAFLVFLAAGLSLYRSGNYVLATLVIVSGLVLMVALWYRADVSMRRSTGTPSGWMIDVKSLFVGISIMVIGVFLLLDPGQVIFDRIHPYSVLIGALGFAFAAFGFMWCVVSLRG